jgi:large repetitive protein
LTQADVLGATVSLDPLTPAPNPPPACATGTSPLLAAGLGVAQELTLVGPTASFSGVVPDYYSLLVTGNNVPTQTPANVAVCPGGTTTVVPSLLVSEGEVSGTVSAADGGDASMVSLQIVSTTTPSTTFTPTITCGASCTYSAIVPLGSAYTVQATLTGYTPFTSPATANLSGTAACVSSCPPASASATVNVAMVAQSHTVDVDVDSATTPPIPAPDRAVVTLSAAGSPTLTGTADPNVAGQFIFSGGNAVPPNPNYTLTVTFGSLTFSEPTVQVPVEPTAGNDPIVKDFSPQFGDISGTVTTADGSTPSNATVTVTDTTTNSVTTPTLTCTGNSCTYLVYGALDSYTVTTTLTGYGTKTSTPTLSAADPTATVTTQLTATEHNLVLTLESGGSTPLTVPSSAEVTLALPATPGTAISTGTAASGGGGAFDFSQVAPGTYTVVATFDSFTVTGSVVVPVADPSGDPVTLTPALTAFAEVSGSVALNPAPSATTTTAIVFCTNAASAATCNSSLVGPTLTAQVDATGTAAPFQSDIPVTVAGFMVSAPGYTASGPIALNPTNGSALTPALVTLQASTPPAGP